MTNVYGYYCCSNHYHKNINFNEIKVKIKCVWFEIDQNFLSSISTKRNLYVQCVCSNSFVSLFKNVNKEKRNEVRWSEEKRKIVNIYTERGRDSGQVLIYFRIRVSIDLVFLSIFLLLLLHFIEWRMNWVDKSTLSR